MVLLLPPEEYITKPSLNYINKNYGPVPEKPKESLQHLGRPHVESFNFMLGQGLQFALQDLRPVEFEIPETKDRVSLRVCDVSFSNPQVTASKNNVRTKQTYPSEFRQRGGGYKGAFSAKFTYSVNGVSCPPIEKNFGNLPVMLRSKVCNLAGMSPEQLVKKGEHEQEWGGYFVVGGNERLIRMLQTTRRNYPIAMQRSSWKNRGANFSDMGVLLECGKRDLTTTKNVVHYVTTGNIRFMFSVNKELFFVPVVLVLKCLKDVTDSELYSELMVGAGDDSYRKGVIINMIRELQEDSIFSRDDAREYIGKHFKERIRYLVPAWYTDAQITDWLIDRSVAVHLDKPEQKYSIICTMVRKLFSFIQNKCIVEGADSLMMHELILGGHLYLQILKEKLGDWLNEIKALIIKKARLQSQKLNITPEMVESCSKRCKTMETVFTNFLGTGNLPSRSGLGLMQDKGLTIMAENINRMRYMSHFRAVHRGAFFMEMRTTEVRALLPDAWGFICPVHTPDGAPCGLLNHLAMPVEVVTHYLDNSQIPQLLAQLGMVPIQDMHKNIDLSNHLDVLLDGISLGFVHPDQLHSMADRLRAVKINPNDSRVPQMTEIACIPKKEKPGQYPGLFIFTSAARMMRPVWNVAGNCVEYIGTLEQVYMEICVREEEANQGVTTHKELRPTNFLSNLACAIPLPDFNQSPRNMYQCQMSKQTMATPIHTWHITSDTKIYRLQTPTAPFFRPAHYDYIGIDDYPMGTNAIVAVISYTGYDMEDAMIINKMSLERGFCAGMIYKSEFIDLRDIADLPKGSQRDDFGLIFDRNPKDADLRKFLDVDGLPYIGTHLREGDPLCCYLNEHEAKYCVKKYTHSEDVIVDSVKLCSNDTGTSEKNRVCITFRIARNPTVGDKFASRAGQKGICSQKWPCEDIPWTTSGLFPDIIFNPHGFPSRMTIAMMIEQMAGKSGAIHGKVHDATPFTFSEDADNDAITYFAEQLESAGYNYYGNETLYSGVSGVELKAEIFFGVIHYQRLRHMVSDKFQVRSTGPVDTLTCQPVKGRRRGGGVRFGEMERDSMLSHGAAFLLQDRIFHGSDRTVAYLCRKCGNLLSPTVKVGQNVGGLETNDPTCVLCNQTKYVELFEVPYIFLHLVKELISVNIKVNLTGKLK